MARAIAVAEHRGRAVSAIFCAQVDIFLLVPRCGEQYSLWSVGEWAKSKKWGGGPSGPRDKNDNRFG